jgi:Flp pilus assembly secretin CpaC
MTCAHTRQRLSELPVDRFHELAAHLSTCDGCRALAEAITTREAHVVRYVEEHLQSDTFAAALAAARAAVPATRPATGRWTRTALVVFAAAAALALALRGRAPPPFERDLAAPPPVAVPGPAAIHLGVGRSAVLALEEGARSLSLVDPTVAEVAPLGRPDLLRITGARPGRSQLYAELDDGAHRVWWVVVGADAGAPVTSDADEVVAIEEHRLALQVGERHAVDLPWAVASVNVGDPALVEVVPGGPRRLALDGRAAGTTDVLVRSADDALALYVVTVRE